jgi:hypothetical protein
MTSSFPAAYAAPTVEWAAVSFATKAEDGIDTFIFRDGLIRLQTVRYTVQHTN